jgi:hypothetical protein
MATDFDLRVQRLEHRRKMVEKLAQRRAESPAHEAKYPTQRPNGITPIKSEWFEDKHGVMCRLLSDDPETIAVYSAAMEARRGGGTCG